MYKSEIRGMRLLEILMTVLLLMAWIKDDANSRNLKEIMLAKQKPLKDSLTFKGEKANVTSAFAPKFTSTAILSPRPLSRKGKISEIISQPIGPKDNCKTNFKSHNVMWYKMKQIGNKSSKPRISRKVDALREFK